ncbi:GNAT family N-acetyltransferase [Halosimplex salinum]|uniref:GNAT family N-acetyltransferase n=1 Tax=Halosimplex salinum TaxID=1710538 RepID=UPI000F46D9E9|nr:GNAT family N-acetyltransferase [Halosimplex salinum]
MSDESCSHWEPENCEGSIHCPPRCPRFVDRTGEPWVVRPPTAEDREALVDMYDDFALGQQAQGLPPRTRPRIEGWLDDVLTEGCNFVVAGDDRLVGHALYTPTDEAEPEFAVFVHQDYQSRGIGTEVSKHVVAAAAAGDREALTLVVEPDNRAARRLYDRLGFETVEQLSYGQGGIQTGIVRMRREFGPAAAAEFRCPPVVRNRPSPAD